MRYALFLTTILLLAPLANAQITRESTSTSPLHRNDTVLDVSNESSLKMGPELFQSKTIAQMQSLDNAIRRKQIEEAIAQASIALDAAVAQYGSESIHAAQAGFNYGYLLSQVRVDEEAEAALLPVIVTLENADRKHQLTLAKAYLSLAKVSKRDQQRGNADKALALFESNPELSELELANYRENAANILIEFVENRERAESLYLLLMPVYEKHYGTNSERMIPVLIGYAESLRRRDLFNHAWRRTSNFKKALKAAKTHQDPIIYADASFAIGTSLLYRTFSYSGGKYTKKALKIYKKELGDQHIKTGAALQNMGFYHQLGGRTKTANRFYLDALDVFRSNENFRNYEVSTLMQLVHNYELINQSDKATPYCRAIGEISPWISDQTPKILYRKRVDYWPGFESGTVVIEFSIDADGFVQNAKVTETAFTPQVDKVFLKAMNGFRYSPKFENGIAVASHNHSERFTIQPR